jgi:hypothetical protein
MCTVNNRLRYDTNTYRVDLQQSVGPGGYVLHTPWPNCNPCFQGDPRVSLGTTGAATCAPSALVDVDSELIGITRRASRNPAELYKPGGPPVCASTALPDCAARAWLPVEDTRLSNPPCTLRGTGWNRWEWLCQDPQRNALMTMDININSQLVAKDNHRPNLPRPLDPTLALPPGARGAGDVDSMAVPEWALSYPCTPPFAGRVPDMRTNSCAQIAQLQWGVAPPAPPPPARGGGRVTAPGRGTACGSAAACSTGVCHF